MSHRDNHLIDGQLARHIKLAADEPGKRIEPEDVGGDAFDGAQPTVAPGHVDAFMADDQVKGLAAQLVLETVRQTNRRPQGAVGERRVLRLDEARSRILAEIVPVADVA